MRLTLTLQWTIFRNFMNYHRWLLFIHGRQVHEKKMSYYNNVYHKYIFDEADSIGKKLGIIFA